MSTRKHMAEEIFLKERRIEYWEAKGQLPSYDELEEEAYSLLDKPKDRYLFA